MISTLTIIGVTVIFIAILSLYIRVSRKFVTLKITHWLLLVYTGVLVVSMIASPFVIDVKGKQILQISEDESEKVKQDFYAKISKGKIDEISNRGLLKHSSFEFHQPSLKINFTGIETPLIYIEKTKTADQRIEAYAFVTGLFINGVDFTEKIQPPRFIVSDTDGSITIHNEEHQTINVSLLKNEFTITQFLGGAKMFSLIKHDAPVIYLKVPKDLEITSETGIEPIVVE